MKLRSLIPLCAFGLLITAAAHAQIVIIANPGVHAINISKDDVRDIFTGTATTLKGSGYVTPVLLKLSPPHEEFLIAFIGKSDAAFRASWRSTVFSGQGTMPRTFDSEASVVDYVARTAGAIGYINKSTPHDGVKILPLR